MYMTSFKSGQDFKISSLEKFPPVSLPVSQDFLLNYISFDRITIFCSDFLLPQLATVHLFFNKQNAFHQMISRRTGGKKHVRALLEHHLQLLSPHLWIYQLSGFIVILFCCSSQIILPSPNGLLDSSLGERSLFYQHINFQVQGILVIVFPGMVKSLLEWQLPG
ncbi:unnamed protein product [Fraxinus pennsylvanica]|uniref:Uncharacterized protein n=1 Tax=Fraxinus pennsylvanica TaxID=56036 RepID=A0AAD2DPX4_9LAMI|nr:unnamed protein product [Fraxinus pennsylvanica]